ncbi:MAG TPA: hypothetical protein EYO33_09485 [Phycisphaerales bacterium]|nr:hypothetical protein [Phycisphaerales bacterium]
MNITARVPLTSVRSYDGANNNLAKPAMNKAGETYSRAVQPAYTDSFESLAGADRANPRTISNAVCAQSELTTDEHQLSAFSWTWGQFLDHDMVLTPSGERPDISVKVPAGDPHFDPRGGGKAIIPVARSLGKYVSGQREQYNNASGWIDASMVYGASPERAAAIRSFEGGKLKESQPGYLPYNVDGLDNEDPFRGDPTRLFLAGDRRANENLALASMQTLFMREHNRLAGELAQKYPGASDEEIYQSARKVVGAQIQKITFDEFLPSLLGKDALPAYEGYKPDTDAGIHNIFASAAFRMGHSQVSRAIRRIEENGDETQHGHLCLRAGYHQASERLISEGGVDPVLRGLSEYLQEKTDTRIIDDLRNFLFGAPGHGGLDLASVNIQRGRDHGLPSFNAVREAYGLEPVSDFSQLSDEKAVVDALKSVYKSPDELDPWVGFLAEKHDADASVGPTLKKVLADQFTRLRDGDRFFYKNDPDIQALAPDIDNTRLVDIIKRNTDIVNIQDDLFIARDDEPFDDPCRS